MIFSSHIFLLAFLPVVLIGYWLISVTNNSGLSKLWLIFVSFFFYGYWDENYVILLATSIAANFSIGWVQQDIKEIANRKLLLILAIVFNLGLLGYFKYLNFFFDNISFITGGYQIEKIILPIGLSFYTFQQITYQIDCYRQMTPRYSLLNYSLFVTFFPQLIAGPIVHHSEMLPQFAKGHFTNPKVRNLVLGLCIFSLGLFKKVVLADTLGGVADPIFDASTAGGQVSIDFLQAWIGMLSYGFQLYFDFSGYSDMAVGIGTMFGIKLPHNFFSPLKAPNMILFWRRWHMSLTREINHLLYTPLSLSMNRVVIMRNISKSLIFIISVAFPTLFIWFIVGAWHGAGWNYILMGLLYGFYITFNHFTRFFIYNNNTVFLIRHIKYCPKFLAVISTSLAYFFASVLFRAEHVSSAMNIYNGLFNLNLADLVVNVKSQKLSVIWLVVSAIIVWTLPSSMHYFGRYKLGLDIFGWQLKSPHGLQFRLSYKHVMFCAVLALISLYAITGVVPKFIYFDF